MAKDVTLLGASYEDVPAVELPQTGGGTAAFHDVSGTTATAADVARGKTFLLANGEEATGQLDTGGDGVAVFYGTCSTAAATAAKAVDCDGFASAHLTAGTVLLVKFANAQTYNGAPTLDVEGTGAVNIKRVGTTNAARYEWVAGEVICFVHDGTYWTMADGGLATTSYYGVTKLATTATGTGTGTALTPASLNSLALNMVSGAPVYSASSTYAVGDRVRYGYQTWECTTAITAAEAWNAAHWTALDPLQEQIDAIGTVPSPSSAAPAADGTAAAGTSADYARADHVHPTDTSRQAALVSGTNIKTINGESLLGSGDIAVSGGASVSADTCTLTASGWNSSTKNQTVNVTGVTASNNVIVSPDPSHMESWTALGIKCTAQAAGTLTFYCAAGKAAAQTYSNVLVNVLILG